MRDSRPHVLLIMVDQLAAQWLPAYGHPVVQAPILSALARDGMVFDSAYCPSPLCAPSRSALISGRLASEVEVYDNAAELRASVPTLAHHLRALGYHTCLAGKMHFVGPDQLHGFEERLTTDIYPADLDWTPDWELPLSERLPWYHTMESIVRPGVCAASMQMDYDDEVAFRSARALFDHARHNAGQPLFLMASFTHPHDPWELSPRYWERYDADAIDAPAVRPIPLPEADEHSRRLREMCGVDEAAVTEEQVRHARHAYYAAISYVDERIGTVLEALRASGLERDTIVAFTADHGEMLGERGLWYKMSFFEASARVPLVMAGPGVECGRVAEPVSVLDLAPTLLQLAAGDDGVELAAGMDGVSLLPQLTGEEAAREGSVVSEYLAEGVIAPAVMVRRGRHKLIVCDGDPDQLYDLEADPHELVNLASLPEHEETLRALRAEVEDRWDLHALRLRVLASQRDRRLVSRALHVGTYAPWDFQPHTDASMQYVRSRADMYDLQRNARLDVNGAAAVAAETGARADAAG